MADLATVYTLTTGAGTITFNNGNLHTSDDLYWIQGAPGLNGSTMRTVIDKFPLGDGGIPHPSWRDVRHFTLDGAIVIQSVPWGADCTPERNAMEDALITVAEGAIAPNGGTLAWTPTGLGARALTVYYEFCEITPAENFMIAEFSLGLYATSPSW